MLSLYPLFLILLTFSSTSSSVSDTDNTEYTNCSSMTYPCAGKLQNISFPFRSPQSSSSCGHPGFVLECSHDNTTLLVQIDDKEYQVKDIDYGHHLIHLTDETLVAESTCPANFTNTTFDFSLFDYSAADVNLTVLSDCSSTANFPGLHSITCPAGSYHHSFYALPGDPLPSTAQNCSSVVYVPVINQTVTDMAMNDTNDFSGIVKGGFSLKWKVEDGWCAKCIASRGICGSDPEFQNASPTPACFCPEGTSIDNTCVDLKSKNSGPRTWDGYDDAVLCTDTKTKLI